MARKTLIRSRIGMLATLWLQSGLLLCTAEVAAAQEPIEFKAEPAKPVEAQAAAVAVMDVAVDAAVIDDVQIVVDANGMVEQSANQLLVPVAVDNALIRRLCKLNAEQLKRLDGFDEKWVKKHTKQGKAGGNLVQGIFRAIAVGGAQPEDTDSISPKIAAAHRKELAEILTPEQLAEFKNAVQQREDFQKRANAECVVAILDQHLCLSAEQRAKLLDVLVKWPSIQRLETIFYFQNQGFLPSLPKEVSQLLDDSQRAVLTSIQTADFHGDMFGGGDGEIVIAR